MYELLWTGAPLLLGACGENVSGLDKFAFDFFLIGVAICFAGLGLAAWGLVRTM